MENKSSNSTQNSKKKKDLKNIPILFTRGSYIFPSFEQTLEVGREASVNAIKIGMNDFDYQIVLLSQKDIMNDNPEINDIYQFGVLASFKIKKSWEDGSYTVTFKSLNRILMEPLKFDKEKKYYYANGKIQKSKEVNDAAITKIIEKYGNKIVGDIKKIVPNTFFNSNDFSSLRGIKIVDSLAQFMVNAKISLKQKLLEELDPTLRLDLIFATLNKDQDKQNIDKKITDKIKSKVDQQQREYYLREKLKAIKEELGELEGSNSNDVIKNYKKRLEEEPFPEHIKERVLKEINHYEMLPQIATEANVILNYIDWIMSIPWHERSTENYDLDNAQKILDSEHYGLEKVKQRIIEHLAVKKIKKSTKGQIICLVGPPGVGKTSLAKSIAKSIGRKFVKVSLGGVRDEAEIRGHRKTYIGAMPGRIIQTMKKAKVLNPVFLLDEIDKIASYRGDPTSALLEVLDPEQNTIFSDHFIEEEYNLQDVMFITTANYYENIPEVLIDRMEILQLSSYTEIEKYKIATQHLIPRVLDELGLNKKQLKFKQSGINEIIKYYTREAGVRNLERCIKSIARKFIFKMLKGDFKTLEVTNKVVNELLKLRPYEHTKKENKSDIGVVTGLAYTQYGGDILPIEVNYFLGKGNLILTGKLGDVMKESASIALDYIKANAKKFKINQKIFDDNDIHIHVPEGAVPKDGPSAGITLTTAIVSALSKRPVSHNVGMTGEITLRGKVLPIGGLREKSIAANRSGLKTILIPKLNKKYLEDVPKEVQNKLKIEYVEKYEDVYNYIFPKLQK